MTKISWMAKLAQKLGFKQVVKTTAQAGAATVLAGAMFFTGQTAQADVIDFEDFESLTLLPFVEAGARDLGQGGLDWTRDIRVGSSPSREWTLDNSLMGGQTGSPAYDGWAAWNVDSWIAEQGTQLGRGSGIATGGNTALIADPDAWADFLTEAPLSFNSYYSREYDLTGFDNSTLQITFDYEFASYDSQRGTIEVSFDGGTTWEMLLDLDSDVIGNSVLTTGPVTFDAALGEITPTSSNMIFRIGCLDADNDWWFAVDNISVTTGDGFSDVEDFEGLTLEEFTVEVGDGTDWTRDIPDWTVDNSLSLGGSTEEAYDGWAAMDVFSWADEQGGQGRSLFNTPNPNNTVLVADGDAFYDYDFDLLDPTLPAPDNSFNTFISRTYDVSGFDCCSLVFSFEYEFRIENQQLGVVEVSFDNGATWERVAEWDDNDGANGDVLAGFLELTAGTDFVARQTNNVTFRFGYLDAGNNWWFAVDNVGLDGDPINYVKGDANQDGIANTLDLSVFVAAFFDPADYQATYGVAAADVFDFNCDDVFNSLDISGFVNVVINGY